MKKVILVLILCASGLTVFLTWPGQSQSEKALVMARQSCGLEKSKDTWEFVFEKAPIMTNIDGLSSEKFKSLSTLADEQAVIANRAALLDSRWVPLAQASSKFSTYLKFRLTGNADMGESWLATIDGRIQTGFICRAIQANSNS